jgi:hypothetical protein
MGKVCSKLPCVKQYCSTLVNINIVGILFAYCIVGLHGYPYRMHLAVHPRQKWHCVI